MGRWWPSVAVAVTGLVAAVAAAAAGGFPAGDAARLVSYSVAGAVVAGLLAGVVLYALRRATIGVQAAVAALAAVLAVAIGVAWAASQMFLMKHDLRVLWVVLISAGTVGLLVAVLFGRRVATASRSVGRSPGGSGNRAPRPARARRAARPRRGSWRLSPPNSIRPRPAWPRRRPRPRRSSGAGGSSWRGCRTTSARRSPVCGR